MQLTTLALADKVLLENMLQDEKHLEIFLDEKVFVHADSRQSKSLDLKKSIRNHNSNNRVIHLFSSPSMNLTLQS
jgi:hypothetical protein